MKRSKPDRLILQDLWQRLLCFTITFYFYLHCPEIFWVCVSIATDIKSYISSKKWKVKKEPGIRTAPFVSNNKAVFRLSMPSSAKVQGLAQRPRCRNSMSKSFGRQWSAPLPLGEKATPKGDVGSLLLSLHIVCPTPCFMVSSHAGHLYVFHPFVHILPWVQNPLSLTGHVLKEQDRKRGTLGLSTQSQGAACLDKLSLLLNTCKLRQVN